MTGEEEEEGAGLRALRFALLTHTHTDSLPAIFHFLSPSDSSSDGRHSSVLSSHLLSQLECSAKHFNPKVEFSSRKVNATDPPARHAVVSKNGCRPQNDAETQEAGRTSSLFQTISRYFFPPVGALLPENLRTRTRHTDSHSLIPWRIFLDVSLCL